MKSAMALVRNMLPGRDADPDAIAARIADTRHVIEQHREDAESLTIAWRDAEDAAAAEKVEARRRECLRLAERGEAALPGLDAALIAARATKERVALARHLAAVRALYPKLRSAIETAASVQHECILARQAAIAELGEGIVQQRIPIAGFMGICVPDSVAIWRNHQDSVFAAEPAAVPPVAVVKPAPPVSAKPAAPQPVAPVTPKPKRVPRRDKVAPNGRLVTLMRSGVELPDGTQGVVGDVVAMLATDAERLVMSGAGDYFTSAS
jgi:hypothetical protein